MITKTTTSLVSSMLYSIGQIAAGLLMHPYQTMQSLVRDKVFIWMTLLPAGFLAVVTIGWKFFIVPAVRLLFSCSESGFLICNVLPFCSNWLTFFCLYWQIMLLYLLVRFSRAFE